MLNTVIKLQKDNAVKHIVILFSLFFSLNIFANNQVTCEFKHSNIADDVFVITHDKESGTHSMSEFENNLIKGFVSYLKGNVVVHIVLLETNQAFNLRGSVENGNVLSSDFTTPEFGYWISVNCR